MMRRHLTCVAALLAAFAIATIAAPAFATPGPPEAPEYWFDQWHIEKLWQDGATGKGVVIAELDTGVNAQLDGLRGKVLTGTDFSPQGGDGRTDRDADTFGHGTAMASIMVGAPSTFDITGIAPDAKILPVALPLEGTTTAADRDFVAQGIRWSVDHGARVISMAIGSSRAGVTQSCPADEQKAVYYALSKGAIVLAAGGNNAQSGNPIEAPAVCLGVLAVGATDQSGTVADFSSKHHYLSFVAPGQNVASLGREAGTGFSGDGTSQATAIASAVAALVWSKHPTLTAREVEARILYTLDNKRETPSPDYGFGALDAYRATLANVPADAPDAVYARAEPYILRAAADAKAAPAPRQAADHVADYGPVRIDRPANSFLTRQGIVGITLIAVAVCGFAALLLLVLNTRERTSSSELALAGGAVEGADDAAQ
jgi:subtilisin family serine protease